MEPILNLGSFDSEIIEQIFHHLPPKSIFLAQLVCQSWRRVPSKFFWENYTVKAKNGELDGEAIYQLAIIYFKAAKRNAKYYPTGSEFLEQAANCGHAKAQCEIGFSYLHTANWLRANQPLDAVANNATFHCFSNFKKAAEFGNIEAQYQYGMRFKNNKLFLLSAAEKNHSSAQCQLGRANSPEADEWLHKAILNGSREAFLYLAQKKGFRLPAWRDMLQLKLTLGFHLAKKLLPEFVHCQDLLREGLAQKYLFFTQFPEVQIGFACEIKRALDSWENQEEKEAFEQLLTKKRPAALNLAHFYMRAEIRNEAAILACFNIELEPICPGFTEYSPISLLPYFDFMDAWREDPLLPKIKAQFSQAIQAAGHPWAVAAFLADCFPLFMDEEEVINADLSWCEKRLLPYLNLDQRTLLYFLFKLHEQVRGEVKENLIEQIKEIEKTIPFSELEKLFI